MPKKIGNYRHPDIGQASPDSYRPSAARRGYGSAHRKNRLDHFRKEPFCRRCRQSGRIVPGTVLDHIVPLSQGGKDIPSNWQTLCASCHGNKTKTEDFPGKERRPDFSGFLSGPSVSPPVPGETATTEDPGLPAHTAETATTEDPEPLPPSLETATTEDPKPLPSNGLAITAEDPASPYPQPLPARPPPGG